MYGLKAAPTTVLDALAALYDPVPQPDLGSRVISLLGVAVPADSCSYTRFDASGVAVSWQSMPADLGTFPQAEEIFQLYLPQHPVLAHHRCTRNGRSRRISDFLGDRQYRMLGLYRDFYRPTGVDYRVAVSIPDGSGGLIGVALNRQGRDFCDAEIELVDSLRVHVSQAHAIQTILAAPPPGFFAGEPEQLTDRQRQIIRLVAEGHTDRTIGRLLGISTRTVQAHLQHAYRTLDASSRTEALARLRLDR